METPINILLISHYFLPRHTAGTEIYTYRLGKALKERGHSIHILAGEDDPGALAPRMWDEDVDHLTVTFMAPASLSKIGHWRQSLRDGQRPALEPLFENLLRNLKPQIVHIQHLSTLSIGFIHIAKQHRIPVVVMLNDYWFLCQRIQLITSHGERCPGFDPDKCADCLLAPYPFPLRLFGKSIAKTASQKRFQLLTNALRQADLVISPSRHLIKVYQTHGFPTGKIIHSDYGFPLPERRKPLEPGKPLSVGYLGSLVPHKGVHILIDAINRQNGNAQLTIYGSPNANPHYYRELKTRNLDNVKFAGVSDPQNPYPTIEKHDIIVIPSLWDENSPLVIHEAHAAGRPVIASNVGGVTELVKDGVNGILVPPGDVNALSNTLHDLITYPNKLVEMGRQSMPPKSMDVHAQEIERMYSQVLSPTESE